MNCTSGCCNAYGSCPEDYAGAYWVNSSYKNCKYYYNETMTLYIYIGAGIAGIWLLAILIAIICYCYRKHKALENISEDLIKKSEDLLRYVREKMANGRRNQQIMLTEQPIG